MTIHDLKSLGLAAALTALMAMFTPLPALALDPNEMFTDPTKEARARDLGRQLRCLKCRNQSIFDSNAGIAKDLRVVVRERMTAGDTDTEILTYIADRFGDYVLLEPRVSGQTYVLWLAPAALLMLSALGLVAYMRGRSAPKSQDDLTDADLARAKRILDGGTS